MGRIPDHLLRLAIQVAESRWVTIGAKSDPKKPGKKKGGTPVEIDADGTITKGPPALTGKKPSELGQSHMFTGQAHKSQRKMFLDDEQPVAPPPLDPSPKPAAPEPVAQAKPKPKAKKAENMSLLAVVRREGGISSGDFEHADFKEFGLLGALNKKGHSLDDMAATLIRQGHIPEPKGASPGDHLLQLLKQKTSSLLADKSKEYEADYEAFQAAQQEAQADGHPDEQLGEIQSGSGKTGEDQGRDGILAEILGGDGSRGEEAGPEIGPGDAAEPEGVADTSFDFGPAAAPKVAEKPKAAKPRKPKQKKDWEDKQEDKHQKALADIKAADAEKAAVASQARDLLGKVTDPEQKAKLQAIIDKAEGKATPKPSEPPAPAPAPEKPAPTPPPGLDMFGNPTGKPATEPETTPGLFGDQVPVEDKKPAPQETVATQAEKGLDWLDQKQDKKTDGTGEMFGSLFSPGQAKAGAVEPEAGPVAPPAVEPAQASAGKLGEPKPSNRFVIVEPGRGRNRYSVAGSTDDISQKPGGLGAAYFDTQTGQYVAPGKRGPVKAKQPQGYPSSLKNFQDAHAGTAGDLHQKTWDEYRKSLADEHEGLSPSEVARSERQFQGEHKQAVQTALALGIPVPAEVLKDYPELAKPATPALKPVKLSSIDHPAQAALGTYQKAKKDALERVARIRANPRWNDGSRGRPADLQLEMMQAKSAVDKAETGIKAAMAALERIANEQGKTTKRQAKSQPANESAQIRAMLREAF